MLYVNTPATNAQLMVDIPYATLGLALIVSCILILAYVCVIAFKEERKNKSQKELNSLKEKTELDIVDTSQKIENSTTRVA